MFKVNNEKTRTTSMTPFSTVSIVYFEQVNVSWVNTLLVHIRRVTRNILGRDSLGRLLEITALRQIFNLQHTKERFQWEKCRRLDALFFPQKSRHFIKLFKKQSKQRPKMNNMKIILKSFMQGHFHRAKVYLTFCKFLV